MKIVMVDGKECLVSDEDFDFVSNESLRIYGSGGNDLYICRTLPRDKSRYLHVAIAERANMDCSKTIDHIDGDYLNNQRDNLRPATRSQQQHNQKIQKNNTTGYKGVGFDKRKK